MNITAHIVRVFLGVVSRIVCSLLSIWAGTIAFSGALVWMIAGSDGVPLHIQFLVLGIAAAWFTICVVADYAFLPAEAICSLSSQVRTEARAPTLRNVR